MSELTQIDLAPGPNLISREDGKRRIVVTANVRGRDLSSFIADAENQVTEKVKLPAGYWTGWGGQFELLVSATQRLTIVGAAGAVSDFPAALHQPGVDA